MEGFSETIKYDMYAEYISYLEWFKKSAMGDDLERGELIWNALLEKSCIEFTEKETLDHFKMVACKPFESELAQKWFIKAHVAFRIWKAEENSKQIKQLNDEIINQKDINWKKFYTPENLAKSISIEAGELLEHFQWGIEYEVSEVSDELAGVLIYCFYMADALNLDIKDIIRNKMENNAIKSPVDKSKGNVKKYTELL